MIRAPKWQDYQGLKAVHLTLEGVATCPPLQGVEFRPGALKRPKKPQKKP